MAMKSLEKLRDTLCEELEKVSKKTTMSAGDLEMAHKLTDTIKNIDKICIMEEDGEYSQAGDWEAMGRINGRYGDYDRGESYANRGKHYVRGHYSRDGRGGDYGMGRGDRGGMRGGRGGYSRDGGEDLMEHMDKMMAEAETPREREIIKRFKRELEEA